MKAVSGTALEQVWAVLWGWLQVAGALLLLSAAQLPEKEIASQSPMRGHTAPLWNPRVLGSHLLLLYALSSSCKAACRVHVQTQASRPVPSPVPSTLWTFDCSQRNRTGHLSLWYRVNISSAFIVTIIPGITFILTTSTCKLGNYTVCY